MSSGKCCCKSFEVGLENCRRTGLSSPTVRILLRLKMEEPERYREDGMKNAETPYSLVVKTYWRPLLVVGGVWFLYNFLVYPFNIYSSYILYIILSPGEVFHWF